MELARELVMAAQAAGIEITAERAVPDPNRFGKPDGKDLDIKLFNRGKLLLHYLREIPPRKREMLAMMAKAADPVSPVTQNSSQLQHREAFFRAVAAGDEHSAFKMIGHLKEEEHDTGELEFLEATAWFHSNRFEQAIQYAQRVPRDAIDWARAFMLLLESLALQGDIEALTDRIESEPTFVFPDFFIRYLCQVAIENSPAPEQAFHWATIIITGKERPAEPGSGAFYMWNRFSCQLAVRCIEQQRELALCGLAVEQAGGAASEPQMRMRSRCERGRSPVLSRSIRICCHAYPQPHSTMPIGKSSSV
jgi:hypothetical protein